MPKDIERMHLLNNFEEGMFIRRETDNEAVNFYMKYGFKISSLGEKHSITRTTGYTDLEIHRTVDPDCIIVEVK